MTKENFDKYKIVPPKVIEFNLSIISFLVVYGFRNNNIRKINWTFSSVPFTEIETLKYQGGRGMTPKSLDRVTRPNSYNKMNLNDQ